MSIVNSLKALPLFQGIPEARLEQLVSAFRPVSHKAGTKLFGVGDLATQFELLTKGEVCLEESATTKFDLRPLAPLGELGALTGIPRSTTATATTDVEILTVGVADLLGFFDANADDAVNYGAIGAVIGHEITHSFDSSGALFDETGRLANWWTAEDLKRFEQAGAKLAAQYGGYRPFPDAAVNGKLTLGENIADVAGLATAYDAYVLARKDKPSLALEGMTPDQRFFLGWAQAWRSKAREAALRNSLLTNVHAPGQYRAETVRNQEAWYSAFDVKPGQKRYLPPEQRVEVW